MYTALSSSRSSVTYLSIMLKKMLNSVGATTQPCFMPLTMWKNPERLLFNLTWPRWSLCSWITMLRNLGGQPRCSMIIHRPFLLNVSNALVRSTNATCSLFFFFFFCSLHFSWSCNFQWHFSPAVSPLTYHYRAWKCWWHHGHGLVLSACTMKF